MSIVDDITLVDDGPDGQTLVIESADGTSQFHGHNIHELLHEALAPYREHLAEGEAVRQEFVASGGVSWDEFRESVSRVDPEYGELLREQADLFRKAEREDATCDPADDSTFLDAA